MSRKKIEHEKEPNLERWLVSYADFITLLFAVFVTLYAMSQVDKAKVAKVIASTNEAFGVSKSTSAPAFNILDSSTLVPLPNILQKSSTEPRPPTGESVYKTKEQKKPKGKDLVDEAFKTPDHVPVHKKELTETQTKEQVEAAKKALAEMQKEVQLEAAKKELAQARQKEQLATQKIKDLEGQPPIKTEVPTEKGAAAESVPPVAAQARPQQEAEAREKSQEQPVRGGQGKVWADARQFKKIETSIMTFLRQKGAEDKVSLQIGSRGLVISLKDTEFFDSGSATVRTDSMPLLDNIAQAINTYSNSIRIEGYTDNVPIKTAQFPSNWELSTARATNIVHYLVKTHGVSPERLSAVGYGEYHPIADNSTEQGRQKNRRVDIVVLSSAGAMGEPAAGPQKLEGQGQR